MSSEEVCRLCLVTDTPMNVIAYSSLQNIYEKLTDCPLNSSNKPMVVCYMCYHQLKKCHKLMIRSVRADRVLTQILECGLVINQETVKMIERKEYKLDNSLSITPTEITEFKLPEEIKVEPMSYDNMKTDTEWIHVENIKCEGSDFENDILESCNIINEGVIYNEACELDGYAIVNAIDIEDIKHEGLVRIARQQTDDERTYNLQEIQDATVISSQNPTSKENARLKSDGCRKSPKPKRKIRDNHREKSRIKTQERNCKGSTITSNQETFICDYCNIVFNTKNNLLEHIKQHNSHRKCANKHRLSRHLKSNSKRYECTTCHKIFGIKCNFQRHLRTHTKEKPFQCTLCERRFYTKYHLDQHSITHTGEKPFECKICKVRFNRKNNLKTHMNEHSEAKPFKCHICDKDFKRKGNLNEHLRAHTGEKPYKCELCGIPFGYKHMLKNHMKLHYE